MKNVVLLPVACLLIWGCESEKAPDPKVEKAEQAAVAAASAAAKVAEAAGKAAEKSAEAEAKAEKAKEEAAAQKAVDENPLTPCCRALGGLAMKKRSGDYMAASKECGTAMTDKKELKAALPAIKKALGSEALPEACKQ